MFDQILVVDWSANSAPKLGRDSVWIAVFDHRGGMDRCTVTNVATRAGAEAMLLEIIEGSERRTTLVGVDFSLGYPAGTAAALGLAGKRWESMWQLLSDRVADDDRNANNRFRVAAELNAELSPGPGPFWGCPPSSTSRSLTATKPSSFDPLGEWRAVERALRAAGWRPFSSWQLLGAGAVGSQSLLGIPVVERLRRTLGDRAEIWPFTTGAAAPVIEPGSVVFAEVWPSITPGGQASHRVRDARQVDDTARWIGRLDDSGELAELLAPSLDSSTREAVVLEEGWVLGVSA